MNNDSDSEYEPTSVPDDFIDPEVRLWGAVVSLAIIDALQGDSYALHWLRSADFETACSLVNLSPHYIRTHLVWKRSNRTMLLYERHKGRTYGIQS